MSDEVPSGTVREITPKMIKAAVSESWADEYAVREYQRAVELDERGQLTDAFDIRYHLVQKYGRKERLILALAQSLAKLGKVHKAEDIYR